MHDGFKLYLYGGVATDSIDGVLVIFNPRSHIRPILLHALQLIVAVFRKADDDRAALHDAESIGASLYRRTVIGDSAVTNSCNAQCIDDRFEFYLQSVVTLDIADGILAIADI